MRASTQLKSYGTWEAYLCTGRHSGRTNCKMPALSREEIDRAVWHYFETVGLDYSAMVREDEERRSLRLAEVSAQAEAARAELRHAEERLERVRRDYLDRRLSAEHWEDLVADLEPEREAASAALDQLCAQAEATRNEETLRDAKEGDTRRAPSHPRGARRALSRVQLMWTLHDGHYDESSSRSRCTGTETPPRESSTQTSPPDWYIVPTVRADAILSPLVIGRDDRGEPTIEQPRQRLTQLFGLIELDGAEVRLCRREPDKH